jgi:hypothetical protein
LAGTFTAALLVAALFAATFFQRLQHATTEPQRRLMEDYGVDERDASLLMGHAPRFTVAAKIRKALLRAGAR